MRISDWSSDVCSSDLAGIIGHLESGVHRLVEILDRLEGALAEQLGDDVGGAEQFVRHGDDIDIERRLIAVVDVERRHLDAAIARQRVAGRRSSEEHTSELQSLMRTSYAVFCLK